MDIGSLVDHPRRACGQNPVTRHECFDAVEWLKPSRAFVFRGTRDGEVVEGTVENTVRAFVPRVGRRADL